MGKTKFRGEELEAAIKRLPQGRPQMDAYWNAIRQADEAGDPYWRMMFRCRYCYEATFRDDPPKAIPVAAEFCALFEENSEAFIERSPDGASEMHLMIMQMGIDPIVFLPQIPGDDDGRILSLGQVLSHRPAHLLVADGPVLAVCGPEKGV